MPANASTLADPLTSTIPGTMRAIVKEDLAVSREELPRAEAVRLFRGMGEHYKVEIIEGLPEATVSLYRQGEFVDLCRGPHVPSTGRIPAFRLMAMFQIPLVIGIVYIGSLRGAGDTRSPLIITLIGMFLVRLPLAYVFGIVLNGGLIGAWIGMCGDMLLRALAASWVYLRGKWVHLQV